MTSEHDLFALEVETIYELDERERLVRRRSPDHPPVPRVLIGQTSEGAVLRFRSDLREEVVSAVTALDVENIPAVVDLLADAGAAPEVHQGIIWVFPDAVSAQVEVEIVSSGTTESDVLLSRLSRNGIPHALQEIGIDRVEDFWRPWCAVLQGGEIASVAFTVGFTRRSAEVGVATVVGKRGRGLAAAAVGAWSRHPDFWGTTMFYGADADNHSSHRVAERLGLREIARVTAFG